MTKIRPRSEISDFARLIADWRSMAIVHAVYEHHALRYAQLEKILAFSPTVLSEKLARLTGSGIITRRQADGAKEVIYTPTELAKDVVCAYHILEGVSHKLFQAHEHPSETDTCELLGESD